MAKADIGLIGLAVMGENLVLNMESRGYTVACFNRTTARVDEFLAGRAKGRKIVGCHSLSELVASLPRPRKVMMMVKAGKPVDELIDQLVPLLEPEDIVIDGGNSFFQDTIRRTARLEEKGLFYVGTGISGGEEGALTGPSIMPGGSRAAWNQIKPLFQSIAARTSSEEACCDWVGDNGAGHFVKMVHNGIEYGDMQMICETYHLMRNGLGLSNEQMHEAFSRWNRGVLDSYLVEITRDIFSYRDEEGHKVVDSILDVAGQKGTGKWMSSVSLELGQPATLVGEAVFARDLSRLKDERVAASRVLPGPRGSFQGDVSRFVDDLEQALYASKIVSYAQGYQLMRAAAREYGWDLNFGGIALMWRGGCIIRSAFLDRIKDAFDRNRSLVNLLLDPFFSEALSRAQEPWRRVMSAAVQFGIPVPAMSAALAYYDGYRCDRLPTNLLQAQRDYFGAHTYERVDRPRGEYHHTNWTGRGGSTAASTYQA